MERTTALHSQERFEVMQYAFHSRIHGRREPVHIEVKSALMTAGALILTLLIIVILFLGFFVTRAT